MDFKSILQQIFRVVSSYGLAVILLTLLFVLTFLGTLEQTSLGIYAVQEKYFESLFLVYDAFGVVPIPLPGAYLVMVLLFINLVSGGIVRARKQWRRPGMIIAHFGILFMLLGGYVTYKYSTSGNMMLYEGQVSEMYESYYEWDVEIAEPGRGSNRLLIIPFADFSDMETGRSRTFYSDQLPFDIILSGYAGNCRPAAGSPHTKVVDGFYLETLSVNPNAEQNVGGAYITLVNKAGGRNVEGILWGLARFPLTARFNDRVFTIKMRRKRWRVPFAVALDKFTMEKHPGTDIPKVFLSDITKIEGHASERMKITMNEPLRHHGYTFFQSSWGPQNARPGEPLFSVFAVVRNPADQWPLYSCIIVAIGLLIHFMQRLTGYIKNENRKREIG